MKHSYSTTVTSNCRIGDIVVISKVMLYREENFNAFTPIKVISAKLDVDKFNLLLENSRGERLYVNDSRVTVVKRSDEDNISALICKEFETDWKVGDTVQVEISDNMWRHNAKIVDIWFNKDIPDFEYLVEYGEERIVVTTEGICEEL